MTNIYDDVNNLVSNLKKHELTVNFKEIRKKLKEENERLFKKIEEFQKLNIEINTKMLMEGNVEEEKQNKSKEMYDELVKEPLALEYFEKELALNKMLEDVNSIFMNGVRDIYSEEVSKNKDRQIDIKIYLLIFFNFKLIVILKLKLKLNLTLTLTLILVLKLIKYYLNILEVFV